HPAQYPGRARQLQLAQVGAVDLVELRRLRQVGPAAHPELAVAAVAVELLALLPGGARPDVQDRLAGRLDHEHLARLARACQVREGAVRAEPVVAVVAADLERARRDDEPLPGE